MLATLLKTLYILKRLCLLSTVTDPGEGPEGSAPPYFFETPPSPLIWRSECATDPVVSCTAPLILLTVLLLKAWWPDKPYVSLFFLSWVTCSSTTGYWLWDSIVMLVHLSMAGCYRDIPIKPSMLNSLICACLYVAKTIDVKVSILLCPTKGVSSTTAPVKPSLEISSQVLTDYTSREALAEVNLVFFYWHGQHKTRMVSVICHFLPAIYFLFMYCPMAFYTFGSTEFMQKNCKSLSCFRLL